MRSKRGSGRCRPLSFRRDLESGRRCLGQEEGFPGRAPIRITGHRPGRESSNNYPGPRIKSSENPPHESPSTTRNIYNRICSPQMLSGPTERYVDLDLKPTPSSSPATDWSEVRVKGAALNEGRKDGSALGRCSSTYSSFNRIL